MLSSALDQGDETDRAERNLLEMIRPAGNEQQRGEPRREIPDDAPVPGGCQDSIAGESEWSHPPWTRGTKLTAPSETSSK